MKAELEAIIWLSSTEAAQMSLHSVFSSVIPVNKALMEKLVLLCNPTVGHIF